MLAPVDILFFGADNITPGEARTISRLDLKSIALAEVKADAVGAAKRAVAWGDHYTRLLVHLDVDVLAFSNFPIAENVRRREGLSAPPPAAAQVPVIAIGMPRASISKHDGPSRPSTNLTFSNPP